MKPEQFSDLCRRGIFYNYPATAGETVVRGGVEKNGAHWIVTPDGFHTLPTANLTAREFSGGVTWSDADGLVAFTIIDQALCEELNAADVDRERDAAFGETLTAAGSEWLKTAIEGARAATPETMTYHRPGNPTPAPI